MNPAKIKILHVLSDINFGAGPANSLITIIKYLPSDLYISYIAVREQGELTDELDRRNIHYIILNLPKPVGIKTLYFILRLVIAVVKMVCFAKKNKIDLIHVNQARAIWGIVTGRITGIPIIFHAREFLANDMHKRFLIRYSTKIIAISNAVAKSYQINNNKKEKEKISVVYNAVDIDRFNSENSEKLLRNKFQIDIEAPLILMVSKLSENKGHLDFVAACALVKKRFPKACFALVGGELPGHESYAEEVRKAVIKENFDGSFRFFGFQQRVEQFIGMADIVVQPSIVEDALGRVPLEAMAMGKPVVATAVGGIPEIVEDGVTGFLVPKENPEALAAGIIKLLNDKELCRKFGEVGKERIYQHFNARKHAEEISRIYWEVVENAG